MFMLFISIEGVRVAWDGIQLVPLMLYSYRYSVCITPCPFASVDLIGKNFGNNVYTHKQVLERFICWMYQRILSSFLLPWRQPASRLNLTYWFILFACCVPTVYQPLHRSFCRPMEQPSSHYWRQQVTISGLDSRIVVKFKIWTHCYRRAVFWCTSNQCKPWHLLCSNNIIIINFLL